MNNGYYNTKSIFWLNMYHNFIPLYPLSPLSFIAYNQYHHLYDYKKIEIILYLIK